MKEELLKMALDVQIGMVLCFIHLLHTPFKEIFIPDSILFPNKLEFFKTAKWIGLQTESTEF